MALRGLSMGLMALALSACGDRGDVAEPPRDAPAATKADKVAVEGPERRVLAFGDSLFAGYGVGLVHSYPAKLEEALRRQGVNVTIINAAVSGETSSAGMRRLSFALDAQDPKPDLVLLELGGNDMLRGLPVEETRANFAAMLGELRKRNIKVVLMGMRAPPNYGPEYQREFDALYSDLAKEYGAVLIPFWLEPIYDRQDLFQADRIHPTEEGIDILVASTAERVEAALAPVS